MNKDKELQIAQIKGKTAIATAIIGSIGVIVAAIIGIFSINVNIENNKLKENNETLKSEKTELVAQTNQSEGEYNNLKSMYSDLQEENDNLQIQLGALESKFSQYDLLVEENSSLKKEISELQDQLQKLSPVNTGNDLGSKETLANESVKKVSIFDLDTFKGKGRWYDLSYMTFSEEDFMDTYGNEYLNAHIGYHGATDKYASLTPIYLLDKKYSMCEGQIAWSKVYKNHEGSAWIEFYSGDTCIYTTDPITADSRLLTFSFDVTDIEKLTIVKNGSSSTNSVEIIYPYLNLIEKSEETVQ